MRPTASTPTARGGLARVVALELEIDDVRAAALAARVEAREQCGTRVASTLVVVREPHAPARSAAGIANSLGPRAPTGPSRRPLSIGTSMRALKPSPARLERRMPPPMRWITLARDFEADAAAGEQIARLARREARDEEQRQQRVVVRRLGDRRRDQAGVQRARAHVGDVDPGAVVLDRDARRLPSLRAPSAMVPLGGLPSAARAPRASRCRGRPRCARAAGTARRAARRCGGRSSRRRRACAR